MTKIFYFLILSIFNLKIFLKYTSDAGVEVEDDRHGGMSVAIYTNERFLDLLFSHIFEFIPSRV